MSLDEVARTVMRDALAVYADSPPATRWLRHQLDRFDEPTRVAVVGPARSGKSTLVNALVGEQVAPVGAAGGHVFAWYRSGPSPRASAYPAHGPPRELKISRHGNGDHAGIEAGYWPADLLDRVEVEWPTRTLRDVTLLDTPPIDAAGGAAADPGDPAGDFAGADQGSGHRPDRTLARIASEADAVLCLIRNRRSDELHAVRAAFAGTAPIDTIAVLSRTDELGGARIDALTSARQLARRYRRRAELQALCQDVLPVAGLVAQSGRTMTEPEFRVLAALAGLPRGELSDALLSTDRFTAEPFPMQLPAAVRQQLLDRFGLFGLRLATSLVRTGGGDSSARLSAELVQRSGLPELRDAIRRCFVERRGVLKARSALLVLGAVLRREPRPAARRLVSDLERVLAGAHDVHELRLVAALRVGRAESLGDLTDEAVRLVGGYGTGIYDRLGLEYEVTESELRQLILDTVDRWQEHAENPLRPAPARRAAAVVVRSCEGMLAELYEASGHR